MTGGSKLIVAAAFAVMCSHAAAADAAPDVAAMEACFEPYARTNNLSGSVFRFYELNDFLAPRQRGHRVFWEGSHWRRMRERVDALLMQAL